MQVMQHCNVPKIMSLSWKINLEYLDLDVSNCYPYIRAKANHFQKWCAENSSLKGRREPTCDMHKETKLYRLADPLTYADMTANKK